MKTTPDRQPCPVEFTLNVIGGKYKPLILWHLQKKDCLRFSELRRILNHATTKMLTQHLRELEEDGLVARKIYPVIPPKVEYSLTRLGQSILPVLQSMCDWGAKNQRRVKAGNNKKRDNDSEEIDVPSACDAKAG